MIRYLSKARAKELIGTALLRLDFNSGNSWRMEAAIPTFKFLLKHSDKIVIVSHRGRPQNKVSLPALIRANGSVRKFEKGLSLKKDAAHLESHLKRKVTFIPHFRFKEIKKMIARAPRGSIFLLENIRFLKGEESDDPKLAKQLAALADFYVNDSFAVDHRKNASVVAITKLLPSYGGLGLKRELEMLGRVMKNPKRPLVIVLGGAKVKDKLGVIEFFRKNADAFLIGGAAANTLLDLEGIPVGKSLIEKDPKDLKKIRALLNYENLFLPPDWRKEKTAILDIGKKTEKLFAEKIRAAKTIIWSGPMGMVEKRRFASGSLAVARAIGANTQAVSIVGGGQTVSFFKKYKLDKKFSFVSTGGGAMLEFLAGKKLPGIEALKKSRASQ